MKVMFLLYGDEQVWADASAEERSRYMAQHDEFAAFLRNHGSIVAAEALSTVAAATTVRSREGTVTVTEGPFAELAEQLGGFYVAVLPSIDTAIEAVALLPQYTVELRPVVDVDGL